MCCDGQWRRSLFWKRNPDKLTRNSSSCARAEAGERPKPGTAPRIQDLRPVPVTINTSPGVKKSKGPCAYVHKRWTVWPHSTAKYVRTCVRAYRVLITHVRTYVHGFAVPRKHLTPGLLPPFQPLQAEWLAIGGDHSLPKNAPSPTVAFSRRGEIPAENNPVSKRFLP